MICGEHDTNVERVEWSVEGQSLKSRSNFVRLVIEVRGVKVLRKLSLLS